MSSHNFSRHNSFFRRSTSCSRLAMCLALALPGMTGCSRSSSSERPSPIAKPNGHSVPVRPSEQVGSVRQALGVSDMLVGRYKHAAAPLGDGRALVCGGRVASSVTPGSSEAFTDHCEIYDPVSGVWTDAGVPRLPNAVANLTLTLLEPNRVLAVGGEGTGNVALGYAYVFTPAGFQATESPFPRYGHTATLLGNGGVLVYGGTDEAGANEERPQLRRATPELPPDQRWEFTGGQALGTSLHAAASFGDGDVMLIGGMNADGDPVDSVFTYSHRTERFSVLRSLPDARIAHTATELPNGDVLVVGGWVAGQPTGQAYRYVKASSTWQPAGTTVARHDHAAARLDRYVVIAGGVGVHRDGEAQVEYATRLRSVEAYDPTTDRWLQLPSLQSIRSNATLTPVRTAGGKPALLVAGGADAQVIVRTSELLALSFEGSTCTSQAECITGHCVDGLCCDSACEGQCTACNEPGSEGICTPVSGPTRGERRACVGGYSCNAGSCAESCRDQEGCLPTHYCGEGSECIPRAAAGASCAASDACSDGLECSDGVCCKEKCEGPCQQCNSQGECVLLKGAPNANRACAESPHDPGCAPACDGDRAECTFIAGGSCGEPSCNSESGIARSAGTCNALGRCLAQEQECGAFTCEGGSCREGCSKPEHCTSGLCESGVCVSALGKGSSCARGSECMNGLSCVDGACCTSESCEVGSSCSASEAKSGDCRKLEGTRCKANLECASEQCFAGRCVRACSAAGEECAAGELCSEGACVPQDNNPSTGAGGEAGSNGGGDSGAGAGGTSGGTGNSATCSADRRSSILEGELVSCDGHLCNPATGRCATSCKDGRDCSSGYQCDPEYRCNILPSRPPSEGCSVSGRVAVAGPGDGSLANGHAGTYWAVSWLVAGLLLRRRRDRTHA